MYIIDLEIANKYLSIYLHCDRMCLNNLNHAFQSYIHAIINDIMTSDMLCQSDNTFVLVKYTDGHQLMT